jgi:hypothetical protein
MGRRACKSGPQPRARQVSGGTMKSDGQDPGWGNKIMQNIRLLFLHGAAAGPGESFARGSSTSGGRANHVEAAFL